MCMSSPSPPPAPTPLPAPEPKQAKKQPEKTPQGASTGPGKAREDAKRRAAGSGRSSTVLTGGQGAPGGNSAKKSLLGQ